jgi:cobalt-zinc-cadmium efflux system outer membrane protein
MSIIFSHPGALAPGRRPCAGTRLAWLSFMLSMLLGSATGHTVAAETPSFAVLHRQAQSTAPQLLEQDANVQAADADARQARAWTNPTIGASVENLGAPQSGGMSQRQDTYTVTQVLETGGKRAARIDAERSRSAAVGARARQLRLAFAGQLALAYATAEAMQQRRELAEADLGRATEDLRAAAALVDAGREAALRLAQARAGMAAAQAGVELARADADEALGSLSALVGAPEPFTHIDHPFLTAVTHVQPGADWLPDDAPALASAAAERNAVAAQVKVEQTRALPDIGVTLGMRKFGWSDEKAATIGITASVPLFDHNQAGVDAARARVAGAAMRVEGARLARVRALATLSLAEGRNLSGEAL